MGYTAGVLNLVAWARDWLQELEEHADALDMLGILGEIITDGVRNAAFQTDFIYRKQNGNPTPDLIAWSTESLDRGYIEPNSMNTLDINCRVNAEPGALTAQVAGGGKVDFFWPDWPHDVGPVITYIAACGGDCASAALSWVKIDEAGYYGRWAAEKLINNNFTWTTTVPSTIAPGNYVFRHEIINLHGGAEQNGAQLYPQCVSIEITGTGTDTPQGIPGVELYKAQDAGILFDPYAKDMSTYPIPGPALCKPDTLGPIHIQTVPAEPLSSGNATLPKVTAAAPITLSTRTKMLRKGSDGAYSLAYPVSDETRFPLVDADADIGKYVAAILRDPATHYGKQILAASDYYTPKRILSEFEQVTGHRANFMQVDADTYKSFLPPSMAQEMLENHLFVEDPGYYKGQSLEASQELLAGVGLKSTTWKDFLKKNINAFP